MNVTIKYSLSQVGQKASLLAGGNGQQEQEVQVAPDHALFAAAVEQASISSSGEATMDLRSYGSPSYDHLPSVDELIGAKAAKEAAEKAKADQENEKRKAATLAVLTERKTGVGRTKNVGDQQFDFLSPSWPYYADETVKSSADAIAWVAEIDAANAIVQAAYDAVLSEKKAAEEAAAADKEAKKAAFRAELGLNENEIVYRVESGCLAGVPVYESGRRGKNWLAVIAIAPKSPGGLDRQFQDKCKGDLYYDAANLVAGTPVEFGADDVSSRGRRTTCRWYGYVTRRVVYRPGTDDEREYVAFIKCDSGKAAIKAAAKTEIRS